MKKFFAIVIQICVLAISASSEASKGAFVILNGTDVTLGNSLFNITFRGNATAKSLFKNGVNLIDNIPKSLQTWYLDWNGEKAYFSPRACRIVSNTSEKAHVAFIQDADADIEYLYIEFHLVILPNVSGIYQYVKASNPTNRTIGLGEFRTVYRFDHNLMPKVTNIVTSGITPNLTNRPTIQDTTWQLQGGLYWSKYDLCGYIRETPWFGVYGGGFGGWILSASREYHSSGPLKQELLVHHNSLMLNYFHSGHFGTPGLDTYPGWSKFYGPYLVYINTGSEDEVKEDAAKQAVIEQNQWPYSWVDDDEYPLLRGSVSGTVTGQPTAMVVVYDDIERQFDLQARGYLYFSKTDENGVFTINNIRPGNYQIVAHPLAGQGSENLAQKNITVAAGEIHDVGILNLPEPTNIIWAIGETNRRSDRYHYSNEPRNYYWHLLPPANLTFEVGKSKIDRDWYYAQTQTPGVWNIKYTDQADKNGRILRVAFAAASASASITIYVNGHQVGHFGYANDATVYRDALQSGRFHSEKISVPAEYVVNGHNKISFELLRDFQNIANLDLPEPTGILWSIGETNRRADGFRYSNEPRNFYWHLLPPRYMTFTIGKSNPSRDWYFAQPEGVWKIVYEDKPDNNTRILRLAIAAATGSLIFNASTAHLQVDVNNFNVADVEYDNDRAIYRDSLQNGNFHSELLTVPADKIVEGRNEVSLKNLCGGLMYDAISLAVGSSSILA